MTQCQRSADGKDHVMSSLTGHAVSNGSFAPASADPQAPTGEYLLPATGRGLGAQAIGTLSLLAGLWVAVSPWFLMLQHGGGNATAANLIAGLAVAALGAVTLAGPRGYAGLQSGSLLLGAWLIVSPFILDAKFAIAAPMYWSNIWAGAVLVILGLAGLGVARRPTR
jgi:SPW repeat